MKIIKQGDLLTSAEIASLACTLLLREKLRSSEAWHSRAASCLAQWWQRPATVVWGAKFFFSLMQRKSLPFQNLSAKKVFQQTF